MMDKTLNNILAQFIDTTQAVVSFKTLTSGHINQTVEATLSYPTHATSYILQRINTNVFPKPENIMANIETVAQHLERKGYPNQILKCLPLLNNEGYLYKNGSDTESANTEPASLMGGTWRVLSAIENSFSHLTVDSPTQAYDAAYAFGEYGRYLNDLAVSKIHTIIPRFHDADLRIKQYKKALKSDFSIFRLVRAHLDLIFTQSEIAFFENKNLRDIPTRITHNDTKISNILFDKTTLKPTCIIDLDTLQPSTILSDFGDMVRTYTPSLGEDDPNFMDLYMRFDFFEAMVAGFLDGLKNALTLKEKEALVFGAKRTIFVQALRFMTDYLNNDVYYKTQYEDHNLVRAQNQLALYQSILIQEGEMQDFVMSY